MTKESIPIPPPEDLAEVFLRTVDDQPAIVFVSRDGRRDVVPVPLRPVPVRAAA